VAVSEPRHLNPITRIVSRKSSIQFTVALDNQTTSDGQTRCGMNKLIGKVAIVTGASKGIGAGIAKALGAEGASVW